MANTSNFSSFIKIDRDFADQIGPYQPGEWVTAKEAVDLVRVVMADHLARMAIARRAHAGILRTWATLIKVNRDIHRDTYLPFPFWWAEGGNELEQDWTTGDFSTSMNDDVRVRAYGVKFHLGDLKEMVPSAFAACATEQTAVVKDSAGRRISPLWPEWVAEVALYIHEVGTDKTTGVDELISVIADRLALRGQEAPARSTVQDAARAVLKRLRDAGN